MTPTPQLPDAFHGRYQIWWDQCGHELGVDEKTAKLIYSCGYVDGALQTTKEVKRALVA